MPRSIWSGAIAFGLVNVPVRLYGAVSAKEIRFHMLHDADGGRIRQERVCSVDGEKVAYEHIVKGFEVAKGRYVTLEPSELEAFAPQRTKSIDIEDFVLLEDIDPIYFDASYHVVPDKGAARAYALLISAMHETGRVAVGRMVMRTRQNLCALRPSGRGLLLSTMRYADEIVSQEAVELPDLKSSASEREMEMARQLVESLASDFEPEKYRDEYRDRVLELIEKKAEGEEIVAPPVEERAVVVNLADALAASLKEARGKAPARGERRVAKERPAARKATQRKKR